MKNSSAAAAERASDREVVIVRIVDAPCALVYQAFTDPKMMAQWFGPNMVTNPVCELDVRVGGAYRIVMRMPDGSEYPITGVYREVVPRERLVCTQNATGHPESWYQEFDKLGADARGHEMMLTVLFEDLGKKTRLTVRTLFDSAALAKAFAKMGMLDGWNESLSKLRTLANGTAASELVGMRVFDAPRDLVWRAWTEPERIARWFGPKGFSMTVQAFEPRVGGHWRFIFHGPKGVDYPNEWVFTELEKPERIVLDHVVAPKFRLTADFLEEGGRTRMIWSQVFENVAELEKIKPFAVHANEENFDKLGAELSTMK